MDISYNKKGIKFEKDLNSLDKFVIDFTSVLNKLDIDYVIISGYVAILFGRSRISEDIDVFIEYISLDTFKRLWNSLEESFYCINTDNFEDAYKEYLKNNDAIRLAKKDKFIPNIEIKFPKIDLDLLSLKNRIKVVVNDNIIYISPIELQIVFKLSLGSEKDIEDARYLYGIFKEKLNKELLEELFRKLNIPGEHKRYIT